MRFIQTLLSTYRYLVLTDQLLYSGGNFLSTLLLARMLSSSDFGIYSGLILHAYLLMSLGNALCIQPWQVSSLKRQRSSIYASFLFSLQLFFVLASLALSYLLTVSTGLAAIVKPESLLLVGGILMHDFTRKYLLGQQKIRFLLAIDITVTVTQLLILLSSYFQHERSQTVLLLFSCAYFPAVFVFASWLKPSFRHIRIWPGLLLQQFRQAGWFSLAAIIQWGSANLFVVSAGVFISLEAFGAFRLIQSLFGVLNVLFQSLENYVLPSASRLYQQSAELSKAYIRRISRKGILLIGSVLLLLFVFAKQVLFLASGTHYLDYADVLRGMCVLYFILFLSYPIRVGIRITLHNKDFFVGYLLSFLFSLAFFNLFIRYWMLGGVVAGLILSQLILLSFWSYRLHQQKFYLWK